MVGRISFRGFKAHVSSVWMVKENLMAKLKESQLRVWKNLFSKELKQGLWEFETQGGKDPWGFIGFEGLEGYH